MGVRVRVRGLKRRDPEVVSVRGCRKRNGPVVPDLRREAKLGRFLITASTGLTFRAVWALFSSSACTVCTEDRVEARIEGTGFSVYCLAVPETFKASAISPVSISSLDTTESVSAEKMETSGEAGSDLSA